MVRIIEHDDDTAVPRPHRGPTTTDTDGTANQQAPEDPEIGGTAAGEVGEVASAAREGGGGAGSPSTSTSPAVEVEVGHCGYCPLHHPTTLYPLLLSQTAPCE
jgi:hypothetical protein